MKRVLCYLAFLSLLSSVYLYSYSLQVTGPVKDIKFHPVVFFQPGYRVVGNTSFNRYDQNGFFFGKAKVGGKVESKFMNRKVILKSVANISTGVFELNDLFIDIEFLPQLVLRVGQFKVPFLETNEISECRSQFTSKPFLSTLSFKRDRGAAIKGKISLLKIDYFAGVFNGEGTGQQVNINEKYLFTFRVGFSPFGYFNFKDSSDLERVRNWKIRIGVGYAYNPDDSRSKFHNRNIRYTADLMVKFRGFSMTGAYAISNRLRTGNDTSFKPFSQKGWFVQFGYIEPFLNIVEPVFRYERYDNNDRSDGFVEKEINGITMKEWKVPDDAARERYQFGLNFYFAKHNLELKAIYSIFNFLEGPRTDLNGDPLIGDSFELQLQFGIF